MQDKTILKWLIDWFSPPVVAGVSAATGSPLLLALLFGLVTKLVLYFIDKEVRRFALFLREKTDVVVKKIKAYLKK